MPQGDEDGISMQKVATKVSKDEICDGIIKKIHVMIYVESFMLL